MSLSQRFLACAVLALTACVTGARAQVLRVQDLTSPRIAALDRARTVVIVTGGILEQHGPALPTGTDTFMNERWAQALAEAVAARPGWTALMFPTIPLGTSGANVLGAKYVYPGTFTIRPETERALFMDLASELGEQGFRWVFVIHNHGSPLHNLMLDQAADYFRDTYHGTMVNLPGLIVPPPHAESRAAGLMREEGEFEVHAGMSETSRMLFLKPELVAPVWSSLKPNTANTPAEAVRIAAARGWQGYIGSPRLASAAYGVQAMRDREMEFVRTALAILDGADPAAIPRLSAMAMKDPEVNKIEQGTQSWSRSIEARENAWLEREARKAVTGR